MSKPRSAGVFSLQETVPTARCLLRAPSEQDIPTIWSASRHPGFNDGMTWDPPTHIGELAEPLNRSLEGWQDGSSYTWSMVRKSDAIMIGRFGIRTIEDGADRWSIGYWVHPSHQGQGFATEGARALLEIGFVRLRARSICASHAKWNQFSGQVLIKIGMQRVGETEHGFKKDGAWVAEFDYELTCDDYRVSD